MKFLSTLGAILAAAKIIHAADCLGVALTAIPSCAQSCILNGAPSIGCSGTDFDCQCAQEAALYAAVEGCVSSSCPEASFQAVIDGASTGSGSMTVSGTVGSIASNTVSVPASTPASASATATATGTTTSGSGGTSTTSGGAGGGIAGGGAGWTPTSVSNRATATAISAAHHQMAVDLRPFGCAVAILIAAFTLI